MNYISNDIKNGIKTIYYIILNKQYKVFVFFVFSKVIFTKKLFSNI